MSESTGPLSFHVMAKPAGSRCNLSCAYCFFLEKKKFYAASPMKMTDEVLETYLKSYLNSQEADRASVAWQGGEPTLMGLDFFKKSMEIIEKNTPEGMLLEKTIQTNGTLIDEKWCEFLKENGFLVGLSMDGPRDLHDVYRTDRNGGPTFHKTYKAARLMQEFDVDFNVLCTVNSVNSEHPERVYGFFRDELGADWIQFIPIVERINSDGSTVLQEGNTVTERSVKPEEWGCFLTESFNEWIRRDVGKVYINFFEAALASWVGTNAAMCIFDETCGKALALEHNGDLYSCDHFVEPDFLLGNIMKTSMKDLVNSKKQKSFGMSKKTLLPNYCLSCDFLFVCNGECIKNRFVKAPDGEGGLNYLCEGYKHFFEFIRTPMQIMADFLNRGKPPYLIMSAIAEEESRLKKMFSKCGRNEPCPCGSGRKYKYCHGR